jgi:uncharacterized protein (DUF1810 family)
MPNLDRFTKAQENDYKIALEEIKKGKKESFWMWYIFPQIKGLGSAQIAKKFAIRDIEEAIEYLNNDILRARLIEITQAVIDLGDVDIDKVFGPPDDFRLRSCMTLFREAEKSSEVKCNDIFQRVLDKFFEGKDDEKTIAILQKQDYDKQCGIKQEENEQLYTNKTILEKEIDDNFSDDEENQEKKDTTNYNEIIEIEVKQEMPEDQNINMEQNEMLTPECYKNRGKNREISSIMAKVDENHPIIEKEKKNYLDNKIMNEERKCCPECIII